MPIRRARGPGRSRPRGGRKGKKGQGSLGLKVHHGGLLPAKTRRIKGWTRKKPKSFGKRWHFVPPKESGRRGC